MKKLLTILIGLTAVLTAAAQMQDPIHFHSELKRISDYVESLKQDSLTRHKEPKKA